MATNRQKIEVEVTAQSKQAREELKQLKNSIGELKGGFSSTSSAAQNLGLSIGKASGSFALAGVAVAALAAGTALLVQQFKESIDQSNKYMSAMMGLSSVAAAFGQSQGQARDAAMSLAQDGLMSVTEAGEGLKNLLATGFELDEAITLMNAFKDAAAFNRQGTLGFGEAIVGATQGLKNQNSIMVDNVGITKNLSVILNEAGLKQDALMKVTTDASVRQKLYNGLIKEASTFQGDAARSASTLAGQQSSLKVQTQMLQMQIGNALSPALSMLISDFSVVAGTIGKIVIPAVKVLATAFIGLVTAARLVGNAISGVVATFIAIPQAIQEGSLDPLKHTFKVVGQDFSDIMESSAGSITKVWDGSFKDVNRGISDAVKNTSSQVSEEAKRLAKQVANEMKDYARDIEKMTRSFQENLNDLVFAHRDKTKKLQKDMADENKDYEKKLKERTESFDDDMITIEDRHKEKTSSIEEDIAEEEEAIMLSERKREAFQDDKYLQDIDRSKKKLLQLKQDLEKENSEYEKNKAKTISLYQQETEKIKEEHKERINALQAELAIELEIQKKYETDFAALKDKVAEDDITRLKRKFAEEKAERERDHNEKLAELYAQGATDQEAYNKGRERASAQDTQRAIQNAGNTAKQNAPIVAVNELNKDFGMGAIGIGANYQGSTTNQPVSSGGISGLASSIGNSIAGAFNSVVNWFSGALPHFAEGGVVNAPEGQPVMAVVHGGEYVKPNGKGTDVVNNITVNVGIYAGAAVEKRQLATMLWEEVGKLARSQSKSPQELLGFIGA